MGKWYTFKLDVGLTLLQRYLWPMPDRSQLAHPRIARQGSKLVGYPQLTGESVRFL